VIDLPPAIRQRSHDDPARRRRDLHVAHPRTYISYRYKVRRNVVLYVLGKAISPLERPLGLVLQLLLALAQRLHGAASSGFLARANDAIM
jgi:hypothetical protein